ncbi:MFS transporter [Alloscardovia theropitheci]|uniref:MFS transporter n=1 Tax=Alloscardovia theropitheci TaxID=2496842 RepID=A0A4R0QPQ5_9BIFI|nr:MFS transporter [Alloscardovia theropitheci]TCD54232.1 MFS transporter [Alloscardovia theropitheci]
MAVSSNTVAKSTARRGFFESSIARTRITSANVRLPEMALGYLVGPFMALISNAVFAAYLNRYYSDVLGWTNAARFGAFSTLLPIVSVVFVIIGNLFVGRLIDNTRTSQGKARPYLLISAPFVVVAIALLFLTPQGTPAAVQMIWIALSYNLYYAVAYPMFYTAHSSMVALSTRNSNQRGLLATFSNASAVASVGIGASIVIPILLQSYLFVDGGAGRIDATASYAHWRVMMIALCILTAIGILCEYYFTRERITEENMKLNIVEEKLSMKQQAKVCMGNMYWWIIILYFLLFQLSGMIKNGSMSYYTRWMLDGVTTEASAGAAMSTLGLIGGIPTAIGMLVAWPIANKLGKRNAIVIGMIIAVLGGCVSLLDVHSLVMVCLGVVLKGIGSIPAMYVTLALLSDVLDHLEARNGFRSDGFTMSVYSAIMVGMTGLGNGLINAFLTVAGYDPFAATQNGAVQTVLTVCYLGSELIAYAIIAVLMLFLNVEKHVDDDHATIIEHQKAAVLAAGGEWIEPAERLRLEQEEADRLAEIARQDELRARCVKKGLNYEEEEARYQAKLQARQEKKSRWFK